MDCVSLKKPRWASFPAVTVKTTDLSSPRGSGRMVSYVVVSPDSAYTQPNGNTGGGGGGGGGGTGAGGRVMLTVSGREIEAITSVGELTTTSDEKPDEAAAAFTAAIMLVAKEVSAAASARAYAHHGRGVIGMISAVAAARRWVEAQAY